MKYLKKEPEVKAEERISARCNVTRESYDILLGHESGKLTMLRGERSYSDNINTNSGSGTKAGFKKIDLSSGLRAGRTYYCPVCGNKDIVRCGKCRRITCYDGKGHFTCAYCGNSGKVSGTMDSIDAYDNSGMKQDGMKQDGMKQDGMKYYPGE